MVTRSTRHGTEPPRPAQQRGFTTGSVLSWGSGQAGFPPPAAQGVGAAGTVRCTRQAPSTTRPPGPSPTVLTPCPQHEQQAHGGRPGCHGAAGCLLLLLLLPGAGG